MARGIGSIDHLETFARELINDSFLKVINLRAKLSDWCMLVLGHGLGTGSTDGMTKFARELTSDGSLKVINSRVNCG